MNEEIKETLDDVKRHLDYVEATKQSSIRDNEMKTMYDYITNLQQKVEQLENIRKEAIEYIHEHQLVFELSSKKQIQYWFDEFYSDLLNILNKERG